MAIETSNNSQPLVTGHDTGWQHVNTQLNISKVLGLNCLKVFSAETPCDKLFKTN